MRSYELTGFGLDRLQLVDRPTPLPAAGQALVQMRAWSLNFRDLLVVKGQYNPKLKFPFTPLSDGVGEVVAVGQGVTRVKPGDRVASAFMPGWIDGPLDEAKGKTALGGALPGVAAEEVVCDAAGLVHVPAHLSDEEASTLPCAGVTAWQAVVTTGAACPGQTVLVQGTGGVSLFALQFARLCGARVIATSSSEVKLVRVRELGASEAINYKTTPEWGERARALAGGEGVDHVIEVGGAGTLAQSLRAVRMGGRISLIGVLSGYGEMNPVPILMKAVCVQGIYVGSRMMFEAMNAAITQHQMRPVVHQSFAFAELAQALAAMERGAHFGKIVLRR